MLMTEEKNWRGAVCVCGGGHDLKCGIELSRPSEVEHEEEPLP